MWHQAAGNWSLGERGRKRWKHASPVQIYHPNFDGDWKDPSKRKQVEHLPHLSDLCFWFSMGLFSQWVNPQNRVFRSRKSGVPNFSSALAQFRRTWSFDAKSLLDRLGIRPIRVGFGGSELCFTDFSACFRR